MRRAGVLRIADLRRYKWNWTDFWSTRISTSQVRFLFQASQLNSYMPTSLDDGLPMSTLELLETLPFAALEMEELLETLAELDQKRGHDGGE